MKNQAGFKALAGLGAGLLLLGSTWLVQAAVTITKSDGSVCTDGTVTLDVNGVITGISNVASCAAPNSFTITVNKIGSGTGTVSDGTLTGFNCGSTCTQTYPANTSVNVTLTAAADSNSTFAGWSSTGVSPACSGNGSCTITQSITSSLTVTATFTANSPPPGTCGPTPANTTVIDSGGMDTSFAQQTYYPPPQNVTAFKMTVPQSFTKASYFSAIPTSASPRSKLWVVSTCPGVLQPVGNQASCVVPARTDTNTVNISANPSAGSYYCKLTAGQTYYFNAVSKNLLTDTTSNCTTTTNCSFFGSRGSPY